jgi:hypothetical protein
MSADLKLSDQERRALQSLQTTLLTAWGSHHRDVPQILYHYTSADGLTGILSSRSLWLTDLRYMNDLSELQYARDLITARIQIREQAASLTEVQRAFLSRVTPTFDRPDRNIFAASFCEERNLLSQWRAYRGRGGGYAIGFDFFHALGLFNRNCVLRKVIYEPPEQNRLVDDTLDAFLAMLLTEASTKQIHEVNPDFLAGTAQTFAIVIGEMQFALKHPDFREEREWRLVHFAYVDPRYARGVEMPRFRSYEGNVIPYFPVSFDRAIAASRDDTLGVPFPIAELVIGPTINADLNSQSTKALLLSLNPDIEPFITHSEIPLRWL